MLNSRSNHAYTGALSKGWKPFKLVLKGSKLYFYKPPSDRSAAVKELFPTELVVVLEDEGLEDEDPDAKEEANATPRSAKGKEKDDSRRKRTFWGSSTHPALNLGAGEIVSGTLEALVHEAVFSTTFHETNLSSGGQVPSLSAEREAFSSAMMFSLPSVVEQREFEAEFRRCCSMLIDSAGENEELRTTSRKKVEWLADKSLTFHASPADSSSWENWRSTTIPDFPADFHPASNSSGLPSSSSTQAVFAPSPEIASVAQMSDSSKSPNVGTFSPRPNEGGRLLSLIDALAEPTAGTHDKPIASTSNHSSKPWHLALENGGLTRDMLLSLDPQLIARSLFVFNRHALQHVPSNITVPAFLNSEIVPVLEAASNTDEAPSSPSLILSQFAGNEEHPHWLTKLILLQVLISDAPHAPAHSILPHGRSMDEHVSPPRAHSRSEVISAWARIGELCRRTGDECSWRAIFSALCSRPLARLDKVWKRVDGDALRLVQSWVYPHDGNQPATVSELKYVPWAGERITQVKESLDAAQGQQEGVWIVTNLMQAWQHFEALRRDFCLCSSTQEQEPVVESDDVAALVRLWSAISSQGGPVTSLSAKFKRYCQRHYFRITEAEYTIIGLTNSCRCL